MPRWWPSMSSEPTSANAPPIGSPSKPSVLRKRGEASSTAGTATLALTVESENPRRDARTLQHAISSLKTLHDESAVRVIMDGLGILTTGYNELRRDCMEPLSESSVLNATSLEGAKIRLRNWCGQAAGSSLLTDLRGSRTAAMRSSIVSELLRTAPYRAQLKRLADEGSLPSNISVTFVPLDTGNATKSGPTNTGNELVAEIVNELSEVPNTWAQTASSLYHSALAVPSTIKNVAQSYGARNCAESMLWGSHFMGKKNKGTVSGQIESRWNGVIPKEWGPGWADPTVTVNVGQLRELETLLSHFKTAEYHRDALLRTHCSG